MADVSHASSTAQTTSATSHTPPAATMAATMANAATHTLAQIRDVYERLAEAPVVASATFLDHDVVDVTLSYKDHATLSKHTRSLIVPLSPSGAPLRDVPISPIPLDPALKLRIPVRANETGGNGQDANLHAHLREHPAKDGRPNRRFVEVWKAQELVHSVEVTDAHGAFATDETFASASASVDGNGRITILYTASCPRKKDEANPLLRFKYLCPMGEKYEKGFQPALFALRVGRSRQAQLLHLQPTLPDRVFGQAVLLTASQLALTAYDAVPGGRRLGQVYCTNRPSSVQLLTLPDDDADAGHIPPVRSTINEALPCEPATHRLSTEGRSARSPRVAPCASPHARQLIWLETPSGGAHNNASAVMRAGAAGPPAVGDPPAVEEIVSLSHHDDLDDTVGIYLDQLPRDAFFEIADRGTCFGLTTISGSQRIVSIFQLATGKRIHAIRNGSLAVLGAQHSRTTPPGIASYAFVAALRDSFLVQTSHPGQPPSLLLFHPQVGHGADYACHTLYKGVLPASPWSTSITAAETTILAIPNTRRVELRDDDDDDVDIQAIFVRPGGASRGASATPPPCILFPHGGPHSTSTTDYSPSVAALLAAGYSILFPNYHGSLGRSPAFVDSLLGRCGQLDIDDCVATIRYAIERGLASESHVYLQGGSHGGFISAHLAARPDVRHLWKAIAMRNPVTHIGEMWSTTDIRDWCMAECGHPYPMTSSQSAPPSHLGPDLYKSLHGASPLPHAANVVAPMLLLLGESDQRVPPTQGLAEYHAIRARAERLVECCWFTGEGTDHALDGVEASRGAWLAAWMWYEEQGKKRRVELE